ncbi:hypothetical protein [Celeribacter litoreus]|uniref:hypothetical protein n=1 Tax=Celeribacter litoreus TaxID=2876714 RepID=UPI001CCA4985|nr:hypothetical protein [Celeribacter litoreus]MCA0045315.1 hypothetical protein [Celeribacter litoreus]
MTINPHTISASQTPQLRMIATVDALAEVRSELAKLRQREAELCDEIRGYATEKHSDRVAGTQCDVVIETRCPKRLRPEVLPQEILNDPRYFSEAAEQVVLLAPRRQRTPKTAPQIYEEKPTPKDLRPTEHVSLSPLAHLAEEGSAHIEPATLEDAVTEAEALEAYADRIAADNHVTDQTRSA